MDRQKQAALWAQAQIEWATRVHDNREDPRAVFYDMAPRYTNNPQALAMVVGQQPRFANQTIENLGQLKEAAQRTEAEHEAGRLSDTEYESEKEVLSRFARGLDAQQKRANALEFVPKKEPAPAPAAAAPGEQAPAPVPSPAATSPGPDVLKGSLFTDPSIFAPQQPSMFQ
jgi:hypothetical protein